MHKKKGIDVVIYSPLIQVKHKLCPGNLQIAGHKSV
jgi:hypothetical protein